MTAQTQVTYYLLRKVLNHEEDAAPTSSSPSAPTQQLTTSPAGDGDNLQQTPSSSCHPTSPQHHSSPRHHHPSPPAEDHHSPALHSSDLPPPEPRENSLAPPEDPSDSFEGACPNDSGRSDNRGEEPSPPAHPLSLSAQDNEQEQQPVEDFKGEDSNRQRDFFHDKQEHPLNSSGVPLPPPSSGYHDSGQRFPFDHSDLRSYHQNSPSEVPVQNFSSMQQQQPSPSRGDHTSGPSGPLLANHHRNSPFMHRSSPHLDNPQHIHSSPHLHQDSPQFHHHQNSQHYPLNPLGYSSAGRPPLDSPHSHGSPHRKDSSSSLGIGDGRYPPHPEFHSPHHRSHHHHLSPSPHRPPYSDPMQMKDSPHHPMQEEYHHLHHKQQGGGDANYWTMHHDVMRSVWPQCVMSNISAGDAAVMRNHLFCHSCVTHPLCFSADCCVALHTKRGLFAIIMCLIYIPIRPIVESIVRFSIF